MKKLFIFAIFALVFGAASSLNVNAQVTDTAKKVGKKTNKGLHKGWTIGKRVGQKSWRKGKGITKKSYKATKNTVKKIT